MFEKYLSSHPEIKEYSELFKVGNGYGAGLLPTTTGVVRQIWRITQAGEATMGSIRIMLSAVRNRGIDMKAILNAFPDAPVIILYRKSLLKQFISRQVAFQTKQWESTYEAINEKQKIHIQETELLEFCAQVKDDYATFLAAKNPERDVLIISYEEVVADPQGTFSKRIFPFLNLAEATITTSLQKQVPEDSLQDTIANYDNIKHLFEDPRCILDLS